ncbi:unnamed protein product [Absidia cylindrospora]
MTVTQHLYLSLLFFWMVHLCLRRDLDFLEQVIPLTFVEELMDILTIVGCERLFDYVESQKDRLIINMVPGRGKALVLLRTCNELLRRLSKETNTVFCGRILMFLANSFPLGERSGVNLRGDFNSEQIHYDGDDVVDADETMTDAQKQFYKVFWSTRKYFSDPPTVLQTDNFAELQKGALVVFEKFEEISKSEEVVAGAKSSQVAGLKRKSMTMDANDSDLAEQILTEINNDYHFPRLLTNRKLLELQIEDVRFRRNVILQFLILFQYLSGFSQEEKENTRSLLAARGTNKQTLVQPTYTVTEDQVQWITEMESRLVKLLRVTKPHGTVYTDIVLTVLKHERNWIIWKASGCPPFEKPPLDSSILEQGRQQRKKILKTCPSNYRFTYGNMEMTNMYGKNKESLGKIMQSRPSLPTPVSIIDQSMEILEREKNATVEERYNIANGALFQVTRMMFRTHASLIPKVYNMKRTYFNEAVNPGSSKSTSSTQDDEDEDDEEDDDDDDDVDEDNTKNGNDKNSQEKSSATTTTDDVEMKNTEESTKSTTPAVNGKSSLSSSASLSSSSSSILSMSSPTTTSPAMPPPVPGQAITEKHVEMEVRVLKEVKKFILEDGL